MNRGAERLLFTGFIGLVIAGALWAAKDWPIRASIIILLLGGAGLVLVGLQFASDWRALRRQELEIARPTYEVQAIEHQGRWGTLEIWAWLWGLFAAIHLIGFPLALPVFVFLYAKLYGDSWFTALLLSFITSAFLYGIYDRLLSVPWPEPFLSFLFS
jgi:hypothetical protein